MQDNTTNSDNEPHWTVNRLSTITGFDRGTIKRRVNDHQPDHGTEYGLRLLLEAWEAHGAKVADKLDLNQQTALLRKRQRERLEREAAREKASGYLRERLPINGIASSPRSRPALWRRHPSWPPPSRRRPNLRPLFKFS